MPNFVVLDSVGDGNCLFNSFAINLAHQVLSQDTAALEGRMGHLHFKKHYTHLANALLPKINEHRALNGQPALKPLTARSRAKTRHQRFSEYFATFQQGPNRTDIDWTGMQKHLAPILREQVVDVCKNPHRENKVLNIDGTPVRVSLLLREVFQSNIAQSILSYPNTRANAMGGYFQDHPVLLKKMKELFEKHNFDFGPYDNPEAPYDENKLKEDCNPIIEDFSHWFFKKGIHEFYDHKTHGLAQNDTQVNQFALQMLSSLFNIKIAVTRVPGESDNGIEVIKQKDKNLWFYEHRFFTPGPNQELKVDDQDLVFHFRSVPGHWQACLTENDYNKELARTYVAQKSHHTKLSAFNHDRSHSKQSPHQASKKANQDLTIPGLLFVMGMLLVPVGFVVSMPWLAVIGAGISALSLGASVLLSPQVSNVAGKSLAKESLNNSKDVLGNVNSFTPSYSSTPNSPSSADKQQPKDLERKQARKRR